MSAAAVRHRGEIGGTLVATVTTSRDLGLPAVEEEESVTVLLRDRDPFHVDGAHAPPGSEPEYVILLHPAYERRGAEPVRIPASQWPDVPGVSYAYRDPVAAVDGRYEGRWLATFTRWETSGSWWWCSAPNRLLSHWWVALAGILGRF